MADLQDQTDTQDPMLAAVLRRKQAQNAETAAPVSSPASPSPSSEQVPADDPMLRAVLSRQKQQQATATSPKTLTQVRYQVPGQGVQEYTKGSTDEQQFLQRFPGAKAVSSYQRTPQSGEAVSTESPETRSTRETAEAKQSLGPAVAAGLAPLASAAAPVLGVGAAAMPLVEGAVAGLGELGGRSMVGQGGPTKEDVEAAGRTAAVTTALGAAFRIVPKVVPFLKNVVRGYDPADLHAALTDAAQSAAPDAKLGGSVRNVFENASADVQAQSKQLYAQIDAATGGKWSANEQLLQNVIQKMRGAATDEEFENLLAQKMQFQWRQEALLEKMAEQNVPAETIDAAKAAYKKSMALLDADAAVKAVTVPGVETDPSIKGKEIADPKKLLGRVTKLFDSGRLKDAFGEQGAIRLMADSKAADIQKAAVDFHKSIARWGARGLEAAAGYELYQLVDPFTRFGGKEK
jgi:hypothetical protein